MKLEKDGLLLVSAHPDLAEELAVYYLRNQEFLREFEPEREESFFTAAYQREILEKEAEGEKKGETYRFYIKRVENQEEIIGSLGITNVVWGAFCSGFLGAKLDERYINRGYMTKALHMVVDYAFKELKLHRLEANVMPRNRRSLRVLEKCDFVNEGISKYYLNINGVWEDHIHMVKLNMAMHESR